MDPFSTQYPDKAQMQRTPWQQDRINMLEVQFVQFVDMNTKKCKEQTESEDIIAAHIFILAIYPFDKLY